MRAIVSLDDLALQPGGVFPPSVLEDIAGRQGFAGQIYSVFQLQLGFTQAASNDALLDIGEPSGIEWILKRASGTAQQYDDAILQSATAFTRSAEGSGFIYTGTINLAAPVFEKLLGVDPIAQQEQVVVECIADTARATYYFDLWSTTTAYHRIWFNRGSDSAPPAGTGGTLVAVTLTPLDTADTIAVAILFAMAAYSTIWATSNDGPNITFLRVDRVKCGWHHARNSGFTITTTQAGMAGESDTDLDEVSLLSEISFLLAGSRQILPLGNFVIRNSLRRPGAGTNPGDASGTNVRRGSVALDHPVSTVTVTFAVPFPSSAWRFTDVCVLNLVDSTPLNLFPGLVKARSAAGFTLYLNGNTDSANYTLEYTCAMF